MARNSEAKQETECLNSNKIALSNGGYECRNCGSRNITKADTACRTCSLSFDAECVQEKKEHCAFSSEAIKYMAIVAFISAPSSEL